MNGSQLQPPPGNENLESTSSLHDLFGVTWTDGRTRKETLHFHKDTGSSFQNISSRTESELQLVPIWENDTLFEASVVSNETLFDFSETLNETLYNVSASLNETLLVSVNASQECEVHR